MSKTLAILLVILVLGSYEVVRSADHPRSQHAYAALYADALLLGAQLGVIVAAEKGNLPKTVAQCMQTLDPSSFDEVVERVLLDNLTPTELQASDAYARTAAGRKEAKIGMLDVYTTLGKAPPEEYPDVSDAESKAVEAFRTSAVGEKLRRVLESDPVHRAFEKRELALATSCAAQANRTSR